MRRTAARDSAIHIPVLLILLLAVISAPAMAQSPKHEFRGAWIATVINLDWPSHAQVSTAGKQAELISMLDGLRAVGINSVFFQVRAECDALYDSPLEPWSVYLTGQQGRGPTPYFDPLSFAVTEAHARGISLHAWLNPFRCEREVGRYALASDHPIVENPEWMITLESGSTAGLYHTILNPGLDEVHEYVASIVEDILRRYDVDGIHFDDYFYPYPPYEMGSSDLATFDANPRGFGNLGDWRRDNINRFVRRIYDTVQAIKPDAVFGISPFGIWRSGVPSGISGLSGADALFADAVAWLDEGSVDYIAPQLYWPFGGSQDFAKLAPWWAGVTGGRHLYPGLAAYRADPATATSTVFSPGEIPRQIRFGRAESGIQGSILFRAANLRGTVVADSLRVLNRTLAIPPQMSHRDLFPPDAPANLRATIDSPTSATAGVEVEWDPSIFGFVLARSFAVYRLEAPVAPDARSVTSDPENLLARTYAPRYLDTPAVPGTYHYVVTGLSGNFAESSETNVVTVSVTDVGIETDQPLPVSSLTAWPNPFRGTLNLRGEGTLEIFDALGRRVRTMTLTGQTVWRPEGTLPGGLYLLRLTDTRGINSVATVLRIR